MDHHKFRTFESLCNGIASRPTDLDKTFCIFYYACQHIQYSHSSTDQSAEGVFRTGTAVCAGYANFFRGVSVRSHIETIQFYGYSCLSKGAGWDPLHPPQIPKSDHAAVLVIINDYKYLSEPTWGAGGVTDGKWHFDYNPVRFLLPLICTLHDHFPVDGSEKYLETPFPYDRFLRAAHHRPNKFYFRNESHPFTL
jgi:transglutaminase/protease-like cytokinesis protein 3